MLSYLKSISTLVLSTFFIVYLTGYIVEYQESKERIDSLKASKEVLVTLLHDIIQAAKDRVDKADAEKIKAETNLALAHVQDIRTINALHYKLEQDDLCNPDRTYRVIK